MAERSAGVPLLGLALRHEHDVVAARQRARTVGALLGFDVQDQTRLATAVSELARNAFRYAGGGRVEFGVEPGEQLLTVRVADRGPGIADLDAVLEGRYRSTTGMGAGLAGTRRLMDRFGVETGPDGTTVSIAKRLAADARTDAAGLAAVAEALAREGREDPIAEIDRQNQELLLTLQSLREREQELLRLNQELEDTNRGVVALYKELDESVEQLRQSNTQRAQFLSYMSHEFRTPLDSVIAITGLLMDEADGELSEEQQVQVRYVQRSARDLLDLVDDLLDTARVDSGQVTLRANPFSVPELFRALTATLRPLHRAEGVDLVFDPPAADVPRLLTDEGKVSQILRNLVANALKFTARGEIRVSARRQAADGRVLFAVSDTGVGIAPDDQKRIFADFAQVDSSLQRRVKGTGLGLPLSRKLAALLGGTLHVESEPGRGSTFILIIPARLPEAQPETDA